jgi:hypothetical protein
LGDVAALPETPRVQVLLPVNLQDSMSPTYELSESIDFTPAYANAWLPYMQFTFDSTGISSPTPTLPTLTFNFSTAGGFVSVNGFAAGTAAPITPFYTPSFLVKDLFPVQGGNKVKVSGEYAVADDGAFVNNVDTSSPEFDIVTQPAKFTAGFEMVLPGGTLSDPVLVPSFSLASCTIPSFMKECTLFFGVTGVLSDACRLSFQIFPMPVPNWVVIPAPVSLPAGITWTSGAAGTVTISVGTAYLLVLSMATPDAVVATEISVENDDSTYALQGLVQTWSSVTFGDIRIWGPRGGSLVSTDISLELALIKQQGAETRSLRLTQTTMFERGIGTSFPHHVVVPVTGSFCVSRGTYVLVPVIHSPPWCTTFIIPGTGDGQVVIASAVPIGAHLTQRPALGRAGCVLSPPVSIPVLAVMDIHGAVLRLEEYAHWLITVCWSATISISDTKAP